MGFFILVKGDLIMEIKTTEQLWMLYDESHRNMVNVEWVRVDDVIKRIERITKGMQENKIWNEARLKTSILKLNVLLVELRGKG
jgi:hypothetical protein